MEEKDLEPLRRHGLDDVAIHDVAQVTALFAYYNRLADGLGADEEDDPDEPLGPTVPDPSDSRSR